MKQLILTFFAAVLCYSLFFDNGTDKPAIDEMNYIHEKATTVPNYNSVIPDTLNYYAMYNMEENWSFCIPEYGMIELYEIKR